MKFSAERESLLAALQSVMGVVERRQTMPILGNLLLVADNGRLSVTATDLEVELVASAEIKSSADGRITVPGRKLLDICRSLPEGVSMALAQDGERVTVKAGRSRFVLATLPGADFPVIEELQQPQHLTLAQVDLRRLLEKTHFSMAQQDVRYYLNGLLLDLREDSLRCVATDGHRLALCEADVPAGAKSRKQIIVPRKGVMELQRLLEGGERAVELEVGRNHLRLRLEDVTFTSKLIDGRFPDYDAVIPIGADKEVVVERDVLRAALQRAAILSNDKYRGVKLEFSPGQVRIVAHNPEQEEAQEDIEAATQVDGLSIGFNVTYLMEALTALREERVMLTLRDANSSALLRELSNDKARHVVMPLRL